MVHSVSVLDHAAAPKVLASIRTSIPRLCHIFANAAFVGEKPKHALEQLGEWTTEIVKRSHATKGFALLPRQWVVERTLAYRNRRLAKAFVATIASAEAWLLLASVQILVRKVAKT